MKVKCPVAGCDYTVRGANDGFKHWQKYDEFHKQLHRNFLSYFFPDLANSDWSDEVKFRFAYQRWHKQERDQAKQQKKGKDGKGSGTGQNIEIRDGKYIVALHSTVAKAKNDAGVVKQKAVAAANNLKSRIHAFMQNPKGGKQ